MHSPKLPHPDNFVFATRFSEAALRAGRERFGVEVQHFAGDVARVVVSSSRWEPIARSALMLPRPVVPKRAKLSLGFSRLGAFQLATGDGRVLLTGAAARSFGVSEARWVLRFESRTEDRFYGLGEKWGALEKTGLRTKFWNTDVWSDFDLEAARHGRVDPTYASIPYVVLRRGGGYLGVFVEGAGPVFMALNAALAINRPAHHPGEHFYLGSERACAVTFVWGPELASVTRKFQRLVGTTPRPPLWALGHHQCRWGYESLDDLERLDAEFRRHGIPCDGLWLDIGYMERFKVFTLERSKFKGAAKRIEQLKQRGRRVVPILDPGVKREVGYDVYDQGLRGEHFCKTPEGLPYVGMVWPGETHFPDFSRASARGFWARYVMSFTRHGFAGYWLDMNDPSTGSVEPDSMRFGAEALPHATYHNDYALGMARATFAGLKKARPDVRPFLLTRSASAGTSRYAAVWCGDNFSNEKHLALCIPTMLNLALSGQPFNGVDVPGFGGDATDDLAKRWYKACFLFPFLRNHSCAGTREQEPWAFERRTLEVIRRFVRLRNKLLPYLYNLFIEHERTGAAICRPLLHDFDDSTFERTDDQFLVGSAVLQAPCLSSDAKVRRVMLPAGDWYDATRGRWVKGGRSVVVRDEAHSTPLFFRAGHVVAMQLGERKDPKNELSDVELHVFLRKGRSDAAPLDGASTESSATFSYEFDDGESYGYQRGRATRIEGVVQLRGERTRVDITKHDAGFGPCRIRFVFYVPVESVQLYLDGATRTRSVKAWHWDMMGTPLRVHRSAAMTI